MKMQNCIFMTQVGSNFFKYIKSSKQKKNVCIYVYTYTLSKNTTPKVRRQVPKKSSVSAVCAAHKGHRQPVNKLQKNGQKTKHGELTEEAEPGNK